MAGINHVTGEWWWIPGTRGLKRGCPMKDGNIDNKNKTADTGYPNNGRADNAAYQHGAVIATTGIRDLLCSKVMIYFAFIKASFSSLFIFHCVLLFVITSKLIRSK